MDRAGGWSAAVRRYGDGVLAVVAGLLLLTSWYLPWFTMYFHNAYPPSSPLYMSPMSLAQDVSSASTAWVLLGVGLSLILLGVAALMGGYMTWQLVLHVVASALLLLTVCQVLSAMAVFQPFFGHVASGAAVVPDPGALLVVGALCCAGVAVVLAWRRARDVDR